MELGSYRVLTEIGRGGMGVVLRGTAPDGTPVAIKLLHLSRAGTKDALARFDRERRLLAELGETEGFVPLVDAGDSSRGPWIAMKLIEGGTLRGRLAKGPLGADETLRIGRSLARALALAHERGIVHRDLKPENVLFTADGRPLVADLGLAKHFRPDVPGGSQTLGISGSLDRALGSAGYAPPEQVRDLRLAGPPADVFALGAMLYECLAGRPAFTGATLYALLEKLEKGELVPLRAVAPGAPAWLAAAIERALAVRPEDRFRDGRALFKALSGGAPASRARVALALAAFVAVAALAGGAVVLGSGSGPRGPTVAPTANEDEAKRLVARGRELLERGRRDEALGLFLRALESDPEHGPAWSQRALVEVETGDARRALGYAEHGVRAAPHEPLGHEILGAVQLKLGDPRAAISAFDRAIQLSPARVSAWLGRGGARARASDLDGARADLEHAVDLDRTSVQAAQLFADVLARRGERAAAIAVFNRVIELRPDDPVAWRMRGRLRVDEKDAPGGIADLGRAIELAPRDAMNWFARAYARYLVDDYALAIEDFTRVIELEPRNENAFLYRGLSRAYSGKWAEAISDLSAVLELEPDHGTALCWRGVARWKTGDARGARRDLERGLELPVSNEKLKELARATLEKLGAEK